VTVRCRPSSYAAFNYLYFFFGQAILVNIPKATLKKISKELRDERAKYGSRDTGRDKGNKSVQKRKRTSGYKKLSEPPRAFTEQGVAMLSSVLLNSL